MANIIPIEELLIIDKINEIIESYSQISDEDYREYEIDKIKTANMLFATLNIHLTKMLKYGTTLMATDFDTEELKDKTMVIKCFTSNDDYLNGIEMNNLPDDVITIGWILESNTFEFRIGNTRAALVEILGGTSFSTVFNDSKFNLGNELYRTLITIISDSITNVTNMLDVSDKPGFAMDVDDTIIEFTHKFFEEIEDEEEKGKQAWFMGTVWALDVKLTDTIGKVSHWFFAEPIKSEKRFIKIYTPEDMDEFNLDLADIPDNMVAMEFNHEARFMRIRIGNEQVFSIEIPKYKDEPIFCGPINDEIKKNELYDVINNVIDSVISGDKEASDE